jgi:phosphocarrier protein FPr
MVSLVLVSHSKKLALAIRALVRQMAGPELKIAVASGVGMGHNELGTDAVHISEVLHKACGPDGALVLMDLGSAVLSAEAALELLDESVRQKIRLCPGPMIEGAVAAAVQASAGSSLDEVCREAQRALSAKQQQLDSTPAPPEALVRNPSSNAGSSSEITITIENEHGLHARPAATLIRALRKYSSEVEISNETTGCGPGSARSLTSLALLQVGKGHRIRVRATGSDHSAALAELTTLAAKRFGETDLPLNTQTAPSIEKAVDGHTGIAASDGIAIGPLVLMEALPLVPPETAAQNPALELQKLSDAMSAVRVALTARDGSSQESAETSDILNAQALLLSDPVLIERLKTLLEQKHGNAAQAWSEATTELGALYRTMDDPYLRARAADVRDLARRVLGQLAGETRSAHMRLDHPAILFTRELLASDAAACDPSEVLGVIAREGSPTAHSAIILRSRAIPMITGVHWLDENAAHGQTVAMDGATGELWLEPDDAIIHLLDERKKLWQAEQEAAARNRRQPSRMLDGVHVEVLANVGNVADVARAAENGAEGVGLLRSEFLFLPCKEAPSEAEQVAALRDMVAAIPGSIVVRTLDIGADKPLQFLPGAPERNPFLGVRGIRLSLRQPEFFFVHLRAILLASAGRDVWVMLPMVSVLDEVSQTRRLVEKAHQQLESEGRAHLWPVKLGAMIEVPAAALLAERLAEEAEFFSIGTNDLTQYVMAVERGSAALSGMQDALHPAVLHLMKTVAEGALSRDRHVSVCGDAASDPLAAAVFVGLGIRSLSVRPNRVAEIKALFRKLSSTDLKRLANEALQCVDAEHVRALSREYLSASVDLPQRV